MTAIIEARPRIPRLAMVFIAAVVVLLLTAPKAGAWTATEGDFKIEKPYSSYGSTEVTVKEYTGNDTNITLPSTVTYSGKEYQVTAVGSNVLKKLAGTEEIVFTVTIPEGYTSIAGNAFQNCYGLKSINVPGSITKIQYNAFEGCKNLASVTFANGSSNLTFGNTVFLNCTSLNSVTLPARLNDLGAGIFQGCTSLSELSIAADNAAYLMQDGNIYAKSDDGESYELHSYSPASSVYGDNVFEKHGINRDRTGDREKTRYLCGKQGIFTRDRALIRPGFIRQLETRASTRSASFFHALGSPGRPYNGGGAAGAYRTRNGAKPLKQGHLRAKRGPLGPSRKSQQQTKRTGFAAHGHSIAETAPEGKRASRANGALIRA